MSDIFVFDPFANSSKGLIARPILPINRGALRADIQSISYAVYNLTDGGAAVEDVLVVADVMETSFEDWELDEEGYSFLWGAPGTLWPDADKIYRIVVTFTTVPALGSLPFVLVWEAQTKSPSS